MLTREIDIREGTIIVERALLSLRLTPDGEVGALFDGRVYPLIDRRAIDVSVEGISTAACSYLLRWPPGWDDEAARAPFEWTIDAGGPEAAIMLNAARATADAAARALGRAGYAVRLVAPAHRPAADGRRYGWMILLDAPSWPPPEQALIAAALAGVPAVETTASQADAASETSSTELAERTEQWMALQDAHAALVERSEEERLDLVAQVALMRAATDALLSRASRVEQAEHDVRKDRDALVALVRTLEEEKDQQSAHDRQELDAAIEGWEAAEEKSAAEKSALNEQIDVLRAELEKLEATPALREAPTESKKMSRSVFGDRLSLIIGCLLPRLNLVRGSLEALAAEFDDPRQVLDDLMKLNVRPEVLDAKRVRSTRNWRERHVPTGAGRDGRLYFRMRSDEPTDVLVSRKSQQSRDIDWMKHND